MKGSPPLSKPESLPHASQMGDQSPPNPSNASNQISDSGFAELALVPTTTNGIVSGMYTSKTMKVDLDLKELVLALNDQVKQVQKGDLKNAESLLVSQALTLNAIFAEMARRAALNMGQHLDATEAYLRLALKAQNQSRATLETLSTIKSPPVLIAKQANITTGHQQVNNVMQLGVHSGGGIQKTQNQLSRATHELRKNTRTPRLEFSPNQTLEAVGKVNRSKVTRG